MNELSFWEWGGVSKGKKKKANCAPIQRKEGPKGRGEGKEKMREKALSDAGGGRRS